MWLTQRVRRVKRSCSISSVRVGPMENFLCSAAAAIAVKLGIGLDIMEPKPDGVCSALASPAESCAVQASRQVVKHAKNAEAWIKTQG